MRREPLTFAGTPVPLGSTAELRLKVAESYAAEPVVGSDMAKAMGFLGKTKIPVIREYITRRIAAGKVAQR